MNSELLVTTDHVLHNAIRTGEVAMVLCVFLSQRSTESLKPLHAHTLQQPQLWINVA